MRSATSGGGSPGPRAAVIASGSHIDSQTPGGRYDGALGVDRRSGRPAHAARAVRAAAPDARGRVAVRGGGEPLPRDQLLGLAGDHGAIAAGASRTRSATSTACRSGRRCARWASIRPGSPRRRRDDLDTWIEVHIEQGPILEAEGLPVGVVDAITAHPPLRGRARRPSDHAGARPMEGRLDPMAGFAEIVTAVDRRRARVGAPAVTTVGRINVEPNLPSAVPDKVTFTRRLAPSRRGRSTPSTRARSS